MKRIFFCTLCFICGLPITAQTTYRVLGFAGKDTLSLAIVSPNAQGQLTFDLKDYKGAVQMIPADNEYRDITDHLEQIKQIKSEPAFNAAKAYVNDTLPFDVLYHSGVWKEYIQQWVGFYAQSVKSADDFAALFVPVAKRVLDRTDAEHPQVAAALTSDLLEFFEQFGLQKAAEIIAAHSIGMNLGFDQESEIATRLVTAMRLVGKQAPPIINETGNSNIQGKNILIFHEIGCGNCDEQIREFRQHYPELKEKGYSVISIVSEHNREVFKALADGLPWETKVCDEGGMSGKNFQNYGVPATPTIYVTDQSGMITGRYARLSETGLLK